MVGYNASEIEHLGGTINTIAMQSASEIIEQLYTKIIVPISNCWYAPEAVTFFEGFATTVANSAPKVQEAFEKFRDAVQKAGENWANKTNAESIPIVPKVETLSLELNVSIISSNLNGNIGILPEESYKLASSLSVIEADLKHSLKKISKNLTVESAFLGGEQASEIEECFQKVGEEISKIFKYLTEGEESLLFQIKKAIQKYSDISNNIGINF